MITNKQIRNAFTGALAVMALGLFASCSESLVAPADDALESGAVSAAAKQVNPEFCTIVDGVWVCGGSTSMMTTLDGGDGGEGEEQPCELIMGVWHCPPDSGS